MPAFSNLGEIKSLLQDSQEILILTRENPTVDSLASSLALFLSLSSLGKRVNVACPTPTTVEFSNLVAIDKVGQNLGGKNFVISLDYSEGTIEKVSYNTTGNKFNLVIEPKPGAPAFSSEKVHFSKTSASPDLIFVVDSINLEQLGKLYQDEQELYSRVTTINLDYHADNLSFGKINWVDSSASSTSEIVTFLLKDLGLTLTEDVATNLLAGISFATNNFDPLTPAGAFEAAAVCLRAGGKRTGSHVTPEQGASSTMPADWLKPKIFKSGSPSPSFNNNKQSFSANKPSFSANKPSFSANKPSFSANKGSLL